MQKLPSLTFKRLTCGVLVKSIFDNVAVQLSLKKSSMKEKLNFQKKVKSLKEVGKSDWGKFLNIMKEVRRLLVKLEKNTRTNLERKFPLKRKRNSRCKRRKKWPDSTEDLKKLPILKNANYLIKKIVLVLWKICPNSWGS